MMRLAVHATFAELASEPLLAITVLVHISLIVRSIVIWVTAIKSSMLALTVGLLMYLLLRGMLLPWCCGIGRVVAAVLVAETILLLLHVHVSKRNGKRDT